MLDTYPYEKREVVMEPGDVVIVYTDGITDATNVDEEPFGVERLLATIERNRDKPSAALIESIFEAVGGHVGDAEQFDEDACRGQTYRVTDRVHR